MKKIPFTRDGLNKFQAEYDSLQQRRKPAVDDLRSAREKGDLSENSAYRAARSRLSSIDNRIRRLKALIDQAHVVDNKDLEYADIGMHITIIDEGNESLTFRIVNTFESDLNHNQISSFSPLGKALMGKKVNDRVKVETPSGIKTYIVKSISLENK